MAIDPMTVMAGMSAVGNIASSLFGGDQAAEAQKKALKFIKKQTKIARGDIAPYLNIGDKAVPALMDALGLGNSDAAIGLFEDSPLYRLMYGDALQDARDDVTAYTSSRGMLNSGETFRGLADARAKTARSFFGDHVAGLDSLVNRSQSAANTSAGIATGAGAQMANIQSQIGDARLAGTLGANAGFQGGMGDLASILGQRKGQSLYSGGVPGVGAGGMGYSYYGGPR